MNNRTERPCTRKWKRRQEAVQAKRREILNLAYEEAVQKDAKPQPTEETAEVNRVIRRMQARIAAEPDDGRRQEMEAEFREDEHLFRRPDLARARLWLHGYLYLRRNGNRPTRRFLRQGSLLEQECRRIVVEMLAAGRLPDRERRTLAALIAAEDAPAHEPSRQLVFKNRREGRPDSASYANELIMETVRAARKEGRGTEAGVQDAIDFYYADNPNGAGRDQVYKILRKLASSGQ